MLKQLLARFVRPHAFAAVLVLATAAAAQAPSWYYDPVDASSAQTLRATVHGVIDDHQRFPYTSSATDTWDILEQADQDPNDSSRILDLYRNASYPKYGGGNTSYQREHSWPKSYGFPSDGSSNYPYTDCHHLFLCDGSYNGSRSNKPFDTCDPACTEKVTDVNGGEGGGSGVYPGNSNWTSGSGTSGAWEVWVDRRGDVARALMYLDVRYEGGFHSNSGYAEPDLILTDDVALISSSNTGTNEAVGYMGYLSILLQWHAADPVDAKEMARNDVIYAYQGNRNPFVDHPEWVAILFGGAPGSGGGGTAWINEIHYDNAGSDTGEFVEVAGPAGTDLSGWQIVAYNGGNGQAYKTTALSGSIPNQQDGMGTLAFSISGLQNGAPDGVALVDGAGAVVEFLSYEGAFTAADGAASGTASTDIGVSETSGTPVGFSLQRGGTGSAGGDFTWQSPLSNTYGQPNVGQTLVGGGAPVDPWLNEFHYDNAGSDSGEFVEVAGVAGTDLTGWSIVAYNGSNGQSYQTVALSGTIADQSGGYGTLSFAATGLQNGAPDALALIDDQGTVIEFLSYEGTMTATNGAASGLVSDDVGVSETSSTPVGWSLQRSGSGSQAADFTWQPPQAATSGAPNAGQSFD